MFEVSLRFGASTITGFGVVRGWGAWALGCSTFKLKG